jgi:hypothetical protein
MKMLGRPPGVNAMTPPTQTQPFDITAAPRAVLRESVRLLYRVLGEERLGRARENAWEAVCADRARARDREKFDRMLTAARSDEPRRPALP